MTSTEFARKYNLLKCVSEVGARSYLAEQRSLARGRVVLVHFLDVGSQEDAARLLQRLGSVTAEAMDKMVETTEVDGVPVVVTLFMSNFKALPQWIDANLAGGVTPPTPGEFTRAFTSPSSTPAPASSPSTPRDDDANAATMIMQAPQPIAPPPIAPPPPPPPKAKEPGEFTRIFGGAANNPLQPPAPAPFAPLPPVQLPHASLPPAPPPPVPRAEPGEFTRIFGKKDVEAPRETPREPVLDATPLAPLPPPEPAPKKPTSEGFTQLFARLAGTPTSQPMAPPAVTPPPAVPPAPMPASSGSGKVPSEFTRMMGRVAPDAPIAPLPMGSGGASLPPAPMLPPAPPPPQFGVPVLPPPVYQVPGMPAPPPPAIPAPPPPPPPPRTTGRSTW